MTSSRQPPPSRRTDATPTPLLTTTPRAPLPLRCLAPELALEYQRANPRTLVLVTGDHETGGVSLTYELSGPERDIVMRYASGGHTGVLVPLFAQGPGAERITGIIRNDRVGQIMLELIRAGSR